MTLLALLAIAAGAAAIQNYPVRGDTGMTCDAGKAHKLVGRKRSPRLEAQALHLTGAATIRWIPPHAMVTMDYRTDRLNLRLDGSNHIVAVSCG